MIFSHAKRTSVAGRLAGALAITSATGALAIALAAPALAQESNASLRGSVTGATQITAFPRSARRLASSDATPAVLDGSENGLQAIDGPRPWPRARDDVRGATQKSAFPRSARRLASSEAALAVLAGSQNGLQATGGPLPCSWTRDDVRGATRSRYHYGPPVASVPESDDNKIFFLFMLFARDTYVLGSISITMRKIK